MLRLRVALTLVAAFLLVACAQDKQWMKVGESYSTAEFRRDYAECSKPTGALDEDCMRSRGWVDMKPSKGDRAADAPPALPSDPRDPRQRKY
jgi:hypothetical protein